MRRTFRLLIIGISLVLTGSARAALIAECADMKYVESQATTIVEGEIANVEYKKDEKDHLHTYVTVRVRKFIRGKGTDTLIIKQYGGYYEEGGATYHVSDSDSPEYKIGQSGILYLEQPDNPFYDGQYYTTVCATGIVPPG